MSTKTKFKPFEEPPQSIIVWQDENIWLIYDQANDLMTQGTSYQDAIFMLSDALATLGEDAKTYRKKKDEATLQTL